MNEWTNCHPLLSISIKQRRRANTVDVGSMLGVNIQLSIAPLFLKRLCYSGFRCAEIDYICWSILFLQQLIPLN